MARRDFLGAGDEQRALTDAQRQLLALERSRADVFNRITKTTVLQRAKELPLQAPIVIKNLIIKKLGVPASEEPPGFLVLVNKFGQIDGPPFLTGLVANNRGTWSKVFGCGEGTFTDVDSADIWKAGASLWISGRVDGSDVAMRSDDNGLTWATKLGPAVYKFGVGYNGELWALADVGAGRQVYFSDDNGESWSADYPIPAGVTAWSLAADPDTAGRVLIKASRNSPRQAIALMKSGGSWSESLLEAFDTFDVVDDWQEPYNHNASFVGGLAVLHYRTYIDSLLTWHHNLYTSDGGGGWDKQTLYSFLTATSTGFQLSRAAGTIFALVNDSEVQGRCRVWMSTGGAFTELASPFPASSAGDPDSGGNSIWFDDTSNTVWVMRDGVGHADSEVIKYMRNPTTSGAWTDASAGLLAVLGLDEAVGAGELARGIVGLR